MDCPACSCAWKHPLEGCEDGGRRLFTSRWCGDLARGRIQEEGCELYFTLFRSGSSGGCAVLLVGTKGLLFAVTDVGWGPGSLQDSAVGGVFPVNE